MFAVSLMLILAWPPVESKGCFLPTTRIRMADGTLKQLKDMRVGDLVMSWDEQRQRRDTSVVKHIPTYYRHPAGLVEIVLPTSRVFATMDHPFWSKRKQMLVSADPAQTHAEYGLTASLISQREEFEGELGETVQASDIIHTSNASSSIADSLWPSLANGIVEVTTLCLYPYHWFYVHGIRVHNKGCFVGDSKVTMSDGTEKPMHSLRVGDKVLSWDDAAHNVSSSKVVHVPTFQRSSAELVHILLPHAVIHATEDHPFWSKRKHGLVSRNPVRTEQEYGLQATWFSDNEQLEGRALEAVQVQGVKHQYNVSQLNLSIPDTDTNHHRALTTVMTLCLEPLHWFYVHGVRVHNKGGCFVGDSQVTMADGSQKPIQSVTVGDKVLSWDDTARRFSSSRVVQVPTFERSSAELIHILLPHAVVRATEDHPFWSKRKHGLVSRNPALTEQEYGLQADWFGDDEQLEGHALEVVQVQGVLQQYQNASQLEFGVTVMIKVMTLCLEPHHWFYVHGVRVHNKGCFAPWVKVTMSDGSQQRLSDVHPLDSVLSWDDREGRLRNATVIAVEVVPPSQLFQISLVGKPEMQLSMRRTSSVQPSEEDLPFVLTGDHPIYSMRSGGLVSMLPNQTFSEYGINVSEMAVVEMFHNVSGNAVEGHVRPYNGFVPAVMTLHLKGHHWFFADGVRVHNKGFGGGHGAYGAYRGYRGYGYGVHNFQMGPAQFAAIVILATRRRRGTWLASGDDGCYIAPSYFSAPGNPVQPGASTIGQDGAVPVAQPQTSPVPMTQAGVPQTQTLGFPALDQLCMTLIGSLSSCTQCNDCPSVECAQALPGCVQFLSTVYDLCAQDTNSSMFFLSFFCFLIFCCLCFCAAALIGGLTRDYSLRNAQLLQMAGARERMVPSNSKQLQVLDLVGTYTENSETKLTHYNLMFDNSGKFTGSAEDDDGDAMVEGTMFWPDHEPRGQIAWKESPNHAVMEVSGTIEDCGPLGIQIQADYISSYQGTHGRIAVATTQPYPTSMEMRNVPSVQYQNPSQYRNTPQYHNSPQYNRVPAQPLQ